MLNKNLIIPKPGVGFQAALGTSYKLAKLISAFSELNTANFTVHGKDKETTELAGNGTYRLSTRNTSQGYFNYTDRLESNSNNVQCSTVDTTKPIDELSFYVGVSGRGLILGLKYSL